MRVCAAVLVLASGCDGWVDAEPEPAREVDAGAAPVDAGEIVDAGAPEPDAGQPVIDAGPAELDAGHQPVVVDAGAPIPDAGQPARRVPVLVAQGRFGRTAISCDDGLTWVNDRDESGGLRCGEAPNVECFHHAWAPMGIVQAGDAVVATWGWGAQPGRLRRTLDGVTWQDVMPSSNAAGIAAGAGRVVLAASPARISTDDGATWSGGGTPDTQGGVLRHAGFAGRFIFTQDERIHVSDDGVTWRSPPSPAGCPGPSMGLLTHDRTALIVQYGGRVCVTTNAGDTWQLVNVAPAFTTRGVWANGAFFVWNGSTRYRSTDGLQWSSTPSPNDLAIGAVAVTRAGTFVAFKGGWQSDYENERVYRSADGVTWSTVPAAGHAHSHPITSLISAELQASSLCP
ncbi:MAG: hypothetical protein JNK82_06540 [Myxococcaceae bacterium]|nr:hypothetical protein [Myxococcaceae bacterium]